MPTMVAVDKEDRFKNPVLRLIEAVTIYAHVDKAGRDRTNKLAEAPHRHGAEVFVEGVP